GPAGPESIAHCDLKPENVFIANVGGERVAKILDFGVAEVRGAARRAARGADEVALFTPAYGAPEQWNPKEFGETGPWTDVWGLALTLVEALVGEPVIAGGHATVRAQILERKRRPTPRTHGAIVSDSVEAVFARALAVDPRDRYHDAGAFWRTLVVATDDRAALPGSSGPEIPDLIPLARNPSHPELVAAPGAMNFDFDDLGNPGASLDLDLPADEPRAKRSLAPSASADALGLDIAAPPAAPQVPPVLAEPSQHMPRVTRSSLPTPSLAPVTPRSRAQPEAALRAPHAAASSAPPVAHPSSPVERSLVRRLLPGSALAASSVLLTVLDRVYASAAGEVFTLGPVRTSWVAAALLLGGLILCARELASRG
ncbi:MAG TPA: hypothetical protein VLJ38_20165, partial [Polyangiaceae bacterium]|nr:hypothetical protein [Polyangiaceae bacterium]